MTELIKLKKLASQVFNVLLSCFVIAPLVIIYWGSTWKLCDIYIWPSDPTISTAISFVVGVSVQLLVMFFQDSIATLLKFKKCKTLNFIALKIYNFVFAHSCVNFWRGIWSFVDKISHNDVTLMTMNVAQNLSILIILKTTKNVIASPFLVATDQSENCYRATTYFKLKVKKILLS